MDLSAVTRSDLLMWKSPSRSGLVLACVDALFLLYFTTSESLLALITGGGTFVILVGAILRAIGIDLDKGLTVFTGLLMGPDGGNLDAVAASLGATLNAVLRTSVHVLLWETQPDTLLALACFYILNILSSFMSLASVSFIVVNLLFTVLLAFAKVPQLQKLQVNTLEPALNKLFTTKDKLLAKIPTYTQVYKPE